MQMTQSDAIVIKRVRGKGRGVFARRPIETDEVIETCPVLVLPSGSIEDFSAGIGAYVFEWGRGRLALALGYGSLYNHSYRPNARYVDLAERTKLFTAIRDIAAGEEIAYDYWYTTDRGYTLEDLRRIYPCRCGAPSCRGTLARPPRRRRKAV